MESRNIVNHKISLILQRVKMMLMSQELKKKKEAIAWLINELTVNSNIGQNLLIAALLKSEIIPLLCEMIVEMDCRPLVTSTLDCLAKLTVNEQFYRQNHASYVVASILRAEHFLTLKNNSVKDKLVVLEEISYTLEKIFEGATIFDLLPKEICELNQIFEFFKKLLTADTQAYRIIFSAAKITSVILSSIKIDDYAVENDIVILCTVIGTSLNLMRKIVESKNCSHGKYAFRAMVMICAVSAEAIPCCVEVGDRESDANFGKSIKPSINHKANLANCIYSAIMKSVIPNFNKIELDPKNVKFYIWFVTSLNGIYDVNYCNIKDLSNHLVGHGFLQTLPRLTIFSTVNLRNEILLLLSRILTTLAEYSLSLETWLGGAKRFGKFLFNAFKSLPLDPSDWLKFLTGGDDRADALLVLFYYNFLGESISNAALYLPLIVDYIMSSTNSNIKRKSISIRKALWFTFSIAALSHEDAYKVKFYERSVTRLFNDLQSSDVSKYYTHHPAVLVHCLKSTALISEKLRSRIICLWLENGGDVSYVVDANPGQDNSVNYYSLLQMVKTGTPETVDVAMKAISELVKNPETVKTLGNIVWDILQQILSPGYEQNVYNTTSILKLTAMFEPTEIPGSVLVCLLYRLTSFILKNESDLVLVSLGIRDAYSLLSLSVRRNDVRGVKMFTNKPKLIKLLKSFAFDKNDAGLSYLCFNSLSTLIRYQANYSIQCENPVKIEAAELLRQLYLENCFGALKLATSIFTSEIERPIIILKEVSSGQDYDDVIRKIYIQLHMIHSKSGNEGRNLCYALFVGILSHCSAFEKLKLLKILCEVDWTFVMIEITVQGKHIMDPEFMDFVSEWLSYRYAVLPLSLTSGERSLCRDQFETTLDLLGNAALNHSKKYPQEESLKQLIQSLILFEEHFSGTIGTELRATDGNLNKD